MIRALCILEATIGGTRTHLRQVVENVDRRRFELTVACSSERDPHFPRDVAAFRERGITVHDVRMRREIRPLADLWAFVKLCVLIRRGRFAIVHTHSSKAGVLGRVAARLFSGARVVHTPHGFAFTHDGEFGPRKRALFLLVERALGRLTDRLIVVSSEEREVAVQRGIVPLSRVRLQFNGISVASEPNLDRRREQLRAFGVDAEGLLIGSVGLLSKAKGHRHLISALPKVLRELPEVRCLIIGQGDSLEELQRLARREEVSSRVVFTGHVEASGDLLSAVDLFVMPSLWEGMPYALLEAMALGKAVVASRVGGCKDAVLDGETGLLVDPGDADALGEAILRLLQNPDERARMGDNGRRRVGDLFTLERMIEGLERVYEELAVPMPTEAQ